MKVLLLSVTAVTTHHKKAERIGGDESEGFSISPKI